jgi:ribosomal protein S18 acetylase RimI-like enzyme
MGEGPTAAVSLRPVAAHEVEEFLDWFERYWQELETFNDYPDPFSRAEYLRLLREPGDRRFCWIDRDGRHIGLCVYIIGPHWYRRDVTDGYVDEFYVEPGSRRGGVGQAAAQQMMTEFRRVGVREVRLSVLRRNSRAAAFWAGLGFGDEMTRMALRLD